MPRQNLKLAAEENITKTN